MINAKIAGRLTDMERHYQQSVSQLSGVAVETMPQSQLTKLNKEVGRMEPIVSKWQEYKRIQDEVQLHLSHVSTVIRCYAVVQGDLFKVTC